MSTEKCTKYMKVKSLLVLCTLWLVLGEEEEEQVAEKKLPSPPFAKEDHHGIN